MILGSAIALSHELDLFSQSNNNYAGFPSTHPTVQSTDQLQKRRDRLGRLLFIYLNQLASRIGFSVPKTPFHTTINSAIAGPASTTEPEWHELITSWVDLTRLIRSSSEILFPSKAATQECLQSGRYIELLEHFWPLLQQWWNQYRKISGKLEPIVATMSFYINRYFSST
jgi:hypothetical protein